MAEIVWAETALSDLEHIASYLEENSPAFARHVISAIFSAVEPLAGFPQLGRVIPEIGDTSRREIFCFSYRIMYRIDTDTIHIQSIYHGARHFVP